mmetsp:Transcript_16562/g.37833  ORF Transcript_16562/g.37833 Transcript_16562/m.37833 type:complete len:102 (+) Transcript_16562:1999-2304(+)
MILQGLTRTMRMRRAKGSASGVSSRSRRKMWALGQRCSNAPATPAFDFICKTCDGKWMSRPGQCGLESVVAGSFEMASKSTWLSVEFTALCRVCLTELSAM